MKPLDDDSAKLVSPEYVATIGPSEPSVEYWVVHIAWSTLKGMAVQSPTVAPFDVKSTVPVGVTSLCAEGETVAV